MNEHKKTLGQVTDEHFLKNTLEDDPIEYRKVMEKDVMENIWSTIMQAKEQDLYRGRDFYIVLLFKWEKAFKNVPRTYVFARRSCPTPTYLQSVFKYKHSSADLEFLWSLPDKLMYYYLINNIASIPKEQRMLAQFCYQNEQGNLLDWVKKENGEGKDAVIKINKDIQDEH